MNGRARYGTTRLLLLLASLLASGCRDELLTSPSGDPDIRPSFGLGPGQEISVVEDLSPALGQNNVAQAINNAKQITGLRTTSTSKSTAYVWSPPGTVTNLATLGQSPYTAIGHDINDSGQVAGMASNHAALWNPGSLPLQLSEPPATTGALAVAINSAGAVVGTITSSGEAHPGIWFNGGQLQILNLPPALGGYDIFGFASDINDNLETVGTASGSMIASSPEPRAFYHRYFPTVPTYVELAQLPGTTKSSAKAINEAGVIVGLSGDRAVRWPSRSDLPQDLGTLGGAWSVANDVNKGGVIVGTSKDGSGAVLPFRLVPGGFLEKLALPQGATAGSAVDLNDDGHTVGQATFPGGERHALVWWRFSGKYAFRYSSVVLSKTISRSAPGLITIALLSSSSMDARAVEVRTLNLSRGGAHAGAGLATGSDGTLLFQEGDGNGDKLTDLIVSFDAADALGPSARFTSSTELLLKGVVKDRSNALYSTVVVSIR
jgi:uncharacterized membrane protein